ncbi:MAG: hypothetical protein N2C12_12005, partial [Planctomycetales bacterium]
MDRDGDMRLMELRGDEIDELVRRVIAELTSAQESQPSAEIKHISQRVITTNQLVGIGQGDTVGVLESAVITPSAKDYLHENKIRLERSSSQATVRQVFLGATACGSDLSTLITQLENSGMKLHRHDNQCIGALVRLAIEHVQGQGRAVLVTDKSAAAVCLANRTPGVRAIGANSKAALDHA